MTKTEIINAAFKVWGREFYLNTSLSQVARELKVSKPALYRHFCNKQALLDAMTRYFFDDFAALIQADYDKALQFSESSESLDILIRSVTEYFAQNVSFFVFSMTRLHDRRLNNFSYLEELCVRGVDMDYFRRSIQKYYRFEPITMHLIFSALTFFLAFFHKTEKSLQKTPNEDSISRIIGEIGKIVSYGLGFTTEEIDSIDYDKLENGIKGTINSASDDRLLKAVAEAVAETGPWETSMEQVARRLGLSKSSLYCHFKNKQDMLHKLFMTETVRITDFARQGIQQSAVVQEQIYLGIYSIAKYLRSRKDILVALDWMRSRRIHPDQISRKHHMPMIESLRLFDDIVINPPRIGVNLLLEMFTREEGKSEISPWILFLLINMLTRKTADYGENFNTNIRLLFRFLTLGIGGFKQ